LVELLRGFWLAVLVPSVAPSISTVVEYWFYNIPWEVRWRACPDS